MIEAKSLFKDKVVLVTGHTGFKASWLCLWLWQLGAKVIGFSRKENPPKNGLYLRANLADKIQEKSGNISKYEDVLDAITEHQPDFVFHLAAQAFVPVAKRQPYDTINVNAMGTLNVLEAIRNTECVKGALFITTDKVYYNKEMEWGYRENEELGGAGDPYAASKAAADIFIECYRKTFFDIKDETGLLQPPYIATARAGNVIGGGDWGEGRLVKNFVERCILKKIPLELTDLKSTRPWQHVIDCLGGYLLIGTKLMQLVSDLNADPLNLEELTEKTNIYPHSWNIGPLIDANVNLVDFTNLMIKYAGKGSYIHLKALKLKEAKLLYVDNTLAIKKLGWYPILSLEDGVRLTIEWYKEVLDHPDEDITEYSLEQIREFQAIASKNGKTWLFDNCLAI